MIVDCPPPTADRSPSTDSPLFPPFSLVDPAEFDFLISQLDGVLRLLAEMLEVTPRLKAQITERINSVLDERNRLRALADGRPQWTLPTDKDRPGRSGRNGARPLSHFSKKP